MSEERRYFVFCEDNCKFEALTKEQIINAIAEATGAIPESIDVDAAFITKIKDMNADRNLKFWVGTTAQFQALPTKAENTLYILTDDDTADSWEQIAEELADLTNSLNTQVGLINGSITEINRRLDELGFKSGVASYSGNGTITVNSLKKQGKYVIFDFVCTATTRGNITIPADFRPKQKTNVLVVATYYNSFSQKFTTTFSRVEMDVDGVITVPNISGDTITSVNAAAGWETN